MSDKPLLSPEELEALADGLDTGAIAVDTGFNTGAKVRKHDLASEDSSLGVNLQSIDMINERFIRQFRLGLLEVLRTSPRLNPSRVQILRFGDYLKKLKAPLSVNIMRANPLRGYAMVVIEPTVVFSSLDSFFWRLWPRGVRFATWAYVYTNGISHYQVNSECVHAVY